MNLHASHASPLLDRAMALVMAGLATFGGLTACSSNSPAPANQQATNSPSATSAQQAAASSPSTPLKKGDKFSIPCGYGKTESCMEVEIKDISQILASDGDATTQCIELERKPLKADEKILLLDFKATMPENADPEFHSPFRNSPWRAVTKTKEVARAQDLLCDLEATGLNLSDEFPGLSAQDRVYLRVPESTSVIQMKEHELIATIDVAKPSGHKSKPGPNPSTNPAPAAPATSTAPAAPAPQENRPVGTLKTPGLEDPHPLDKSISSCATDYTLYQRGTTFFTDGTSGWTEECAAAMDAAMAQ